MRHNMCVLTKRLATLLPTPLITLFAATDSLKTTIEGLINAPSCKQGFRDFEFRVLGLRVRV